MIGGVVTLDEDMLHDVRRIWASDSPYDIRIAESTASLLTANEHVRDDDAEDILRGQNGRDLFFAQLAESNKDKLKDKKGNEDLFELVSAMLEGQQLGMFRV